MKNNRNLVIEKLLYKLIKEGVKKAIFENEESYFFVSDLYKILIYEYTRLRISSRAYGYGRNGSMTWSHDYSLPKEYLQYFNTDSAYFDNETIDEFESVFKSLKDKRFIVSYTINLGERSKRPSIHIEMDEKTFGNISVNICDGLASAIKDLKGNIYCGPFDEGGRQRLKKLYKAYISGEIDVLID